MTAINLCLTAVSDERNAWGCFGCDEYDSDAADGTAAYRHAMATGHSVELTTQKIIKLTPQLAEFGAVTPA